MDDEEQCRIRKCSKVLTKNYIVKTTLLQVSKIRIFLEEKKRGEKNKKTKKNAELEAFRRQLIFDEDIEPNIELN